MRGVGDARVVVPPRVQHVAGGTGGIIAHSGLLGVELVDEGEARSALGKGVAASLDGEGAFEARDGAAVDRDHGIGVLRLPVFALRYVLVLVVVGLPALGGPRRAARARLVGIEGRRLLEVVVPVGARRLEAGNGVAQLAAGPFIGQEAQRVGFAVPVFVDIVAQARCVAGLKEVVARGGLDARGVRHAQGHDAAGVRDLERALGLIDLVLAQRDEGRGHLDGNLVSLPRVVLTRALDGDHQVVVSPRELVGVDVAVGGLRGGGERRAADLGAPEAVDLHEVAQGVRKRDVAGLARLEALLDVGGVARTRGDGLGDALEYLLELGGCGRRLVIVGILRASAELIARIGGGGRVVARYGMHELVLVARAVFCRVGLRVGTGEDPDGVYRGP